ncbi:hypothetical protein CMEL01_16318, partial [Colletotrichum melonis]
TKLRNSESLLGFFLLLPHLLSSTPRISQYSLPSSAPVLRVFLLLPTDIHSSPRHPPTVPLDFYWNLESCTTVPPRHPVFVSNIPSTSPAQRRQIVSPHTYRPSTPKKEAKGLRSKRGGGICGVPPAQRSNERLCTPTLNLHQQITTPERPLLSLSLTHTYPLSLNPLLPVPVLVPYRTLLFSTVPTCALSTAPPKTPNNNLYSSPRLDSLRLTPKAHPNLTSPPRILSTALSSPSIARTINHPDFDFSTPIFIVTSPIRHLRTRQ